MTSGLKSYSSSAALRKFTDAAEEASGFSGTAAAGVERFDPRTNKVTAVMIGSAAEHMAVDHTRFVDIDAAAHLEIELAF